MDGVDKEEEEEVRCISALFYIINWLLNSILSPFFWLILRGNKNAALFDRYGHIICISACNTGLIIITRTHSHTWRAIKLRCKKGRFTYCSRESRPFSNRDKPRRRRSSETLHVTRLSSGERGFNRRYYGTYYCNFPVSRRPELLKNTPFLTRRKEWVLF